MLRQRLVAHRGYQRRFPENTLLAHREAIAAGARYIETDIQFSRDMKSFLYHDPELYRLSGMEGRVSEFFAEELIKLSAFEPFRLGDTFRDEKVCPLSTLVDYLQTEPSVTVFVEAKEEAIAHAGVENAYFILESLLRPLGQRAVLISFDTEFIAHARKQGYPQTGIVLKSWLQIDSAETAAIAPQYIFTNQKHIPANEDLSRFDSILVVYEIAEPKAAISLFNRGADMVETFDIGGMIAGLSAHSI